MVFGLCFVSLTVKLLDVWKNKHLEAAYSKDFLNYAVISCIIEIHCNVATVADLY